MKYFQKKDVIARAKCQGWIIADSMEYWLNVVSSDLEPATQSSSLLGKHEKSQHGPVQNKVDRDDYSQ